MIQRIFRRKIYDKILKWKEENQGKTALLIEGARREGNQLSWKNLLERNINHISSSTSIKQEKK